MASYVLPQVLVFQEVKRAAQVTPRNQNAFLAGGHAHLVRYGEASERLQGFLGTYDPQGTLIEGELQTCYSWPSLPLGGVVDHSYTRLFVEDATLRYFHDTSHTMIKTGRNKIRHPTKSFISNPTNSSFPRSADFYDRDVKVGDMVVVSGLQRPSGSSMSSFGEETRTSLCTYVTAIEADKIPGVVGLAEGFPDNKASQPYSVSFADGSNNSGSAAVANVDGTNYNGHPSGDLSETYVVRVIQSSTGSDATTARLRVFSASGRDDQSSVTPAAFGSPTNIGTRGLKVTWTGTAFVAGDEWTITVNQAFSAPSPSSAGSYNSARDTSYIITVVEGGSLASGNVTIQAVSSDGSDFSGPTKISASGVYVAVGTRGVTFTLLGSEARKGDRYQISCTGIRDGAYRTLVLAHDLDEDIAQNDAAAAALEVSLYIRRDVVEIPRVSQVNPTQLNWESKDQEICVKAAIQLYDAEWTSGGVPLPLPLITDSACSDTNRMFVQYRAWLPDLSSAVWSVSDPADLDSVISGPIHPDNPLKFGLFAALSANNGQPVFFSSVANPDKLSSWTDVLSLIEDRPNIYNLVPLTFNRDVQQAFYNHVQAQSSPLIARWRAAWFGIRGEDSFAVISESTTTNGQPALAVTEDDPGQSGTQYTLLRITSGNAGFLSKGVRPGDIVRFQYSGIDVEGKEVYQTYQVAAVRNETTLVITPGTATAETTPRRFEIWRTRTKAELASYVAGVAGSWKSDRVVAVWPDRFTIGAYTVDGYFLAAILASQSSGVVPQQGLTRMEVPGIVETQRSNQFSRSQLDEMANAGVWIVVQDSVTKSAYTRHGLTTAGFGAVDLQEEVLRRNRDSVSFYFFDKFSPYIGIANVTPGILDIIRAEVNSGLQFLRGANFVTRLGGQIVDASIESIAPSPEFEDRIVVVIRVVWPVPLNNLEVHLRRGSLVTLLV